MILVWDNVKRLRYNFYWVRAVTYLPYTAETSFENSFIVQKSGALALLALRNVFLSLTKNAKGIYIILLKYQLDGSSKNYPGKYFFLQLQGTLKIFKMFQNPENFLILILKMDTYNLQNFLFFKL